MSESFAELFEESLAKTQMRPGAIITGTIVKVDNDFVTVNAGLKSEGVIPISQFTDDSGEVNVHVGDAVEVALDTVEDGFGETRLSREKAKRAETWKKLEAAHEAGETVQGTITDKVKGGFTVELGDIRAFLPGSLVDVRPVRSSWISVVIMLSFPAVPWWKKKAVRNVKLSWKTCRKVQSSRV